MGQRLVVSVYRDKKSDTPIGRIYYHWSGYTASAYCAAQELCELFTGASHGSKEGIERRLMTDLYLINSIKGTYDPNDIPDVVKSSDGYRDIMTYLNQVYGTTSDIDFTKIDDPQLRLIRICEYLGGGIDGGKDSKEWKYIQAKYPNHKFKEIDISRNEGLIALSEHGMDELQKWSEGDVNIYIYNGKPENIYIENDIFWTEDLKTLMEDNPDFDVSAIPQITFNPERPVAFADLGRVISEVSNTDMVCYNNTLYSLIY